MLGVGNQHVYVMLVLRLWLPLLYSCSPLHYAAWSGHPHIVRQLLVATSLSDRLLLQACWDNYDR